MTILTATPGLSGNIYRDQRPRGRMRQQHFTVAPGVAYDVTARHLGAHAWRVTVRYQDANLITTTLPSNYPTKYHTRIEATNTPRLTKPNNNRRTCLSWYPVSNAKAATISHRSG